MSSDNITVVGSDSASVAASILAPALRRVSLVDVGPFINAYKLGRLRKVEPPRSPSLAIVQWYISPQKALGSRNVKQRVIKAPLVRKELLNPLRKHSAVALLSRNTAVLV